MRRGLPLGSVLGFQLRIAYSGFLLVGLVWWWFTARLFPFHVPGRAQGTYLALGLASTLLFFASLLVHELAHALSARRRGIHVESITLFVFGGMVHRREEAPTPGAEFVMAAVGPVASMGLALLLEACARAVPEPGGDAAFVMLRYLALLNGMLAVLNLLPGYPLDGGRMLRAWLWWWTGDTTRATHWAAAGGRWLGYLLVAFGFWEGWRGEILGGAWLVVVGWFLRETAIRSEWQHQLRAVLRNARAHQTMVPAPDPVAPDLTLQRLVDDHFSRCRAPAFAVTADGALVGIVTREQVENVARRDWAERTVREIMTTTDPGLIVHVDDDLMQTADKLRQSPARGVLVMRGNELEGIITVPDFRRWLEQAGVGG